MSTKAMGRLYTGMGNPSGVGDALGGIGGILASLLGQNKMTGGLQENDSGLAGEDGGLSFTPYQGSSGLFGGQSRQQAAMLNALLGGQVLGQQGAQKLSAQESRQRQVEMKLENELKTHFANNEQMNAMATKYGIPQTEMDQWKSLIAKGVASNLIQQQANVGKGLQSPDVQTATKNQLISESQEQDARNRALLTQNAQMGATSHQPGPLQTGIGTTVTGATPGGQTMQQIPIGRDKQGNIQYSPMPALITQPSIPGKVTAPIPPNLFQQANQITPGGNANITPGGNNILGGGMPSQPQPAIGAANNQAKMQPQLSTGIGSQIGSAYLKAIPNLLFGPNSEVGGITSDATSGIGALLRLLLGNQQQQNNIAQQ